MHRPKVLQLSFACRPNFGSEPGVGWNRAVEAAKYCDVWVLCREQDCREAITNYTENHGEIDGLHFVYVPLTKFELQLAKIPGLFYLVYNLWHRRAWRYAKRLHEEINFDLAHQVTYVGYREPGYLWQLDTPFVWGPLGGTQNYPWRFWPGPSLKGAAFEALRNVCNSMQLRFGRRSRLAARHASAVVVANEATRQDLQRHCTNNCYQLIETGINSVRQTVLPKEVNDSAEDLPNRRSNSMCELIESEIRGLRETDGRPDTPEAELRILWSGNIEQRKALEILLEALGQLPKDVTFELRVLGSGPLETKMKRLAKRLNLSPHVQWLGRLSHQEALEQFQWAEVFAFTSLRETTGTVILESLGAGVPVICFDHQGARDAVNEQCGIKVSVTNRRLAANQFAEALSRLARDRQLLQQLSAGASLRAERFLWSVTGEALVEIYQNALKRAGRDWKPTLRTSNRSTIPPLEIDAFNPLLHSRLW